MSKLFKILTTIILVILALLIVIPIFFKSQIMERVKMELNSKLDAKVEIGAVSLSMFKEFPNLYVEIDDILVIGELEFEGDTLLSLKRFYTGVNLASLISGKEIQVGTVVLEQARVNARVMKDGKANWDILKSDDVSASEVEKSGESSDFKVDFDEISVLNLALDFKDDVLNTRFSVDDLNLMLSGDFSAKSTNLNLNTTLSKVDLEYEKVKYLKRAQIEMEAVVAADLENMIFTLKDNRIILNDMEFGMMGDIGVKDDGYDMNLTLDARKTDIKTLLSLIPDMFKTDLKGVETSGRLKLSAYVKGEYRENILPAFGATLNVENGQLKYPDLPESVENIFVDVKVFNPGGDADNTITDVNSLRLDIAGNPINVQMHIKTPVSDPQLKGVCKGVIDFASLKHAIPIEDVDISGKVTVDVSFDGKMSSIEKERYQDFMAKGDVILSNFEFVTPDLPQGVKILNSVLSFNPRYISVNSFDSQIGKSDLKLRGKIRNYIPYALKGNTLYGDFNLVSNLLDLNEFLAEENADANVDGGDTIPLSVIEIPSNLNLKLVSELKKVRFDKMDIQDVKGVIEVKNSVAVLRNMNMSMLQGSVNLNGSYNVQDAKKPAVDFGMDVKNFDVKSAYNSLSMVKKMIPIAINCKGKISASMKISSLLDQEMNPKISTINGKGSFNSREVIISGNKTFNSLAQLLNNDDYKRISVSKFDMAFVVKNGNVEVAPFNTKIAGHEATIYGTQSVDGELNFTIDMKVPKEELGREVNQYFDMLPGFDTVPEFDVAVLIKGEISSPEVKLDMSKAIKQAKEAMTRELKRRAKKELKNKGDKLKKDLEKKLRKLF